MAELVVHPQARRHGIGAAMIRAALSKTDGQNRFWAHGTLESARATASALGLAPVRELVQMRRSLHDIAEPAAARRGAYPDLRRHRRRRRAAAGQQRRFRDASRTGRLDRRRPRRATRRTMVRPRGTVPGLRRADRTRCWASTGRKCTPSKPASARSTSSASIPSAQGSGLGGLLTAVGIAHLARRLAEAAQPTVMLYVESDNTAALRTYQRLGFTQYSVDTAYAPEPQTVARLSAELFTSRSGIG